MSYWGAGVDPRHGWKVLSTFGLNDDKCVVGDLCAFSKGQIVYSMGNIFYSILVGQTPFEGQKESKAQKKVMEGIRPSIVCKARTSSCKPSSRRR